MPRSIDIRLVNGLLGDPAVYAFFERSGHALMLDVGDVAPLSTRELLKLSRLQHLC